MAQSTNSGGAIAARVWRDLAGLAAEAVAIGVLFSVLLALAVLVMARARPDDRFVQPSAPIEPVAVTLALRSTDAAPSGEDLSAG
jgi:hypothetical protein